MIMSERSSTELPILSAGAEGAPLYGQESLTWKPGDSVFKSAYHFVQVDIASGMMSLTSWPVDLRGATTVIDRTTISPR